MRHVIVGVECSVARRHTNRRYGDGEERTTPVDRRAHRRAAHAKAAGVVAAQRAKMHAALIEGGGWAGRRTGVRMGLGINGVVGGRFTPPRAARRW